MRTTGKGSTDGGRGETARALVTGGLVFSSCLLFVPQGKLGKAGVVIRCFYLCSGGAQRQHS